MRRLMEWAVPDWALRWGHEPPVANTYPQHAGWTVADFHAHSNRTRPRCPIHGTLGGGITHCRYRATLDDWCGQPLEAP